MSLGKFLKEKIKNHGIKKIFKENENKFNEIDLGFKAFTQRVYRMKDMAGYNLWSNMKLLQIILTALEIDFNKLLDEYELIKIESDSLFETFETDDFPDQNELLKEIINELKYIRNQIDKKTKRKTLIMIKYYYFETFFHDVKNYLGIEEERNIFFPLYFNKNIKENIYLIKTMYLEYFQKDKTISDYFYNLFANENEMVSNETSFELFLFYLITHFSICLLDQIDKTNKPELKKKLVSVRNKLRILIKTNPEILISGAEDTFKTKIHEIFHDYLSCQKSLFFDSRQFTYNPDLIFKYIFNKKTSSANYFITTGKLSFNIKDEIIESIGTTENNLDNLRDMFNNE